MKKDTEIKYYICQFEAHSGDDIFEYEQVTEAVSEKAVEKQMQERGFDSDLEYETNSGSSITVTRIAEISEPEFQLLSTYLTTFYI